MISLRTHSSVLVIALIAIVLTWCLTVIAKWVFVPTEQFWMEVWDGALWISAFGYPIYVGIGYLLRKQQLLTDELLRLLHRDRLTDAATRDFFFERLEAEPKAYGVSLMIDIDHFKRVNDQFGHLVGDQVIKTVADQLKSLVRAEDVVCRFGGEEFVVFLKEESRDSGYLIAERMRSAIEVTDIGGVDGPERVTVSIGGSLKDQLDDLEEAIRQADAALYQAKRSGRNRTVFYDEDAKTEGVPSPQAQAM